MKSNSLVKLLGLCLVLLSITSCATSDPEMTSKAHPATYVTDVFAIDNGMPLREIQKKEFYFKNCELESRRAFQSKIEYSCNEP